MHPNRVSCFKITYQLRLEENILLWLLGHWLVWLFFKIFPTSRFAKPVMKVEGSNLDSWNLQITIRTLEMQVLTLNIILKFAIAAERTNKPFFDEKKKNLLFCKHHHHAISHQSSKLWYNYNLAATPNWYLRGLKITLNEWGSISARWRYWSRMIACCVFWLPKRFLGEKYGSFFILDK